jgi:hypothetical protein
LEEETMLLRAEAATWKRFALAVGGILETT